MADITMCNGKNCELANTCYRYKANPTPGYQSYFCEAPIKNGKCDYYWEYCSNCNQYNGTHKMSCPTQKIQINL
jgi:hypothetical protein